MERGNLVVKDIVDYSSKDTTPKSQEQITREFATNKLESYGYIMFIFKNKVMFSVYFTLCNIKNIYFLFIVFTFHIV